VGNRRTLIAAAAVILAAVAGIGVYSYVSSADTRAQRDTSLVEAFVAGQDISKGTSGDGAVAGGMIETAKVLRGSVPADAVTDTSTLKGKVASATISAKQFITQSSFVAPSQGGGGSLAASISSKDLVAVTVSVDAAHGVANSIAPGDHVDVAIVGSAGAQYLLQDIPVLAVGTQVSSASSTAVTQPATGTGTGLVTFEVTPAQALQVVSANQSGTLYLTLHALAADTPGASGAAVSASGQ
jgi:Flp pilus assembly protein CpaB